METIRFSQLLGIYGLTALIFFAIDLLWLGIVAKDLYAHHLGGLLKEKVNWWAAVLFYLVYIGGILAFVLVPALQNGNGILWAVMYGAMLGLFAYCTFDLTCLALVRGWPVFHRIDRHFMGNRADRHHSRGFAVAGRESVQNLK